MDKVMCPDCGAEYRPEDIENRNFAHCYEEKFDSYWELAEAKLAFIRGRYSDDASQAIQQIEDYLAGVTDDSYREEGERYLEILKAE